MHISFSINNLSISFKPLNKDNTSKYILSLLEIEKHIAFDSWNHNNFNVELPLKEMLSFILFVDQDVAGFSVMSQKTKDCVHLHRFCLAKKWQGIGVGKIMMKASINKAQQIKTSYLTLKVPANNTQAINLYNHFNFKDLFIQNEHFFKILNLM